jgi:hypothetical protein
MKNIIFILSIISISIFSCKKENVSINSIKHSKVTRNNSLTPSTLSGILVFNSKMQLDSYIDFLNEIESNYSNGDELDLKLNDIESLLSYTSYRKILNEAYNPIDGFANIQALPIRRYHVSSFQSVLNSNFEIIVSNTYYNYSKIGYGIICKEINIAKLDAIRAVIASTNNVFDVPENIEKEFHFDVHVCLEYHSEEDLQYKNYPSEDNSTIKFHLNEEFGNNCNSKQYNTKVCAKSASGVITSSLAGDYIL